MAMVFFAAMSGSMSHMKDVRANAEAATQKINLAFICDEISYDKILRQKLRLASLWQIVRRVNIQLTLVLIYKA